jgi:UDP-N-acetylmuramoyl-L-alanyl-D-glutamate--2,6-diaminopimelate ligase
MKLRDLVEGLTSEISAFPDGQVGDLEITAITSDSRKADSGSLFVAIPGTKTDGRAFVADAIRNGARAIAAQSADGIVSDVPVLIVDDAHEFLSLAAAKFHGRQPQVMVAVTGTAGKTSVASFTRQIWAHAGLAAAQIGTTGVISPKRNDYGSLTTPDPVSLHKLLRELADEGVTHAAMEASSHGLDQRRLDGVRLSAAAFTNLGRDHMDYHPTVEDYFQAKMRLFNALMPKGAPAIIFADDEWSGRAAQTARDAGLDVKTVGRKGSFLALKRVEHFRDKQVAEVHLGDDIYEVHLPLAGDFQVANALVSAGLAIVTGVAPAEAFAALHDIKGAPGRLELAGHTKDGALCYVDYAHKPEALEIVLQSVRPFTTGKVIVVFGCGGDRDRGKRPIMGEIATRLADVAIVTDDNPRSEVPSEIRAEIMTGAKGAMEIGDRAEAIRSAVGMLGSGDTLIVAGKGHEEGQIIGNVTLPFSDHSEIRKALGG